MLLREWCHQADILQAEGFISSVLGAIMNVVVARSGAQHGWVQLLPAHHAFELHRWIDVFVYKSWLSPVWWSVEDQRD
jgi:hypothetical protein